MFLMTEEDEAVTEAPSEETEAGTRTKYLSGFGGGPSLVSKFPGIGDEVAEFIKQNGFAAQSRRRTEVGFSNGITIKEIQSHLYKTFPALKEHTTSLTTIRRLFQARNKHFKQLRDTQL